MFKLMFLSEVCTNVTHATPTMSMALPALWQTRQKQFLFLSFQYIFPTVPQAIHMASGTRIMVKLYSTQCLSTLCVY